MKERFAKYPFQADARGLTMFEVSHVYQLTPEPPVIVHESTTPPNTSRVPSTGVPVNPT